jgi:hypothetical protein
MKLLILVLVLIVGIVLSYLAFLPKINLLEFQKIINEESKTTEKDVESFVTGKTGISEICNIETNPTDYNNRAICFDICYNDTTTGLPIQVRAQIQPGYYIDASGYLEVVPYGNIASTDKFSYVPSSKTAAYAQAAVANTNAKINEQIAQLKQQIATTPTSDTFTINGLQQKLANLQQQQINNMESNKISNSDYNSDNFDITYHADPTQNEQPDSSTAGVGKMWVNINGSLVAMPYSDVSNTTLYNSSGSYTFNPASYVPNYEESVFLSKLTNQPTIAKTHNLATNQNGFCASTKSSMIERDAKCNSLDKNMCASTDCCILLGGEKCVAGNQNGPTNKTQYSDTTVLNKDYYYYRGECFGNCV